MGQNISEKAVYSVTEAASRAADEAGIISVERDMTGADEKNVAAAGRQRVIQPFIGCHGAVFRKKGDGAPCIPLFYRDKSVGIVKDEARNAVFPAVDGSADGKRVEKHVRRVFRAELFVCQGEFRRKSPEKNAVCVMIFACCDKPAVSEPEEKHIRVRRDRRLKPPKRRQAYHGTAEGLKSLCAFAGYAVVGKYCF